MGIRHGVFPIHHKAKSPRESGRDEGEMRVLTQGSPYGRRGVAGWSMFRCLKALGREWVRRVLLAILAIWLTVLSQGALAFSCSVAFSMPQNTTQTYKDRKSVV